MAPLDSVFEPLEGWIGLRLDPVPEGATFEHFVQAYFDYTRTDRDDLMWAWEVGNELEHRDPDVAWPVFLALIAAAPDPHSLGTFAAGPIEDTLRTSGAQYIDRLEAEAPTNARLREALSGVWIGPEHVGQDVYDRIAALMERDPANWPIGESGFPRYAEPYLASDRIEDRRWAAELLVTAPYTPLVRAKLLEFLRSGDERMRESAAQGIAWSGDAELLPDLIAELNGHSGQEGGYQLMWSVGWLAQKADREMQRAAESAIQAISERGDDQMKQQVRHQTVPGAAEGDWHQWGTEMVATFGEFVDGLAEDGMSADDVAELRKNQAMLQDTVDSFRARDDSEPRSG